MERAEASAPLSDLPRARLELPGGAYHLRLRALDATVTAGGPYREAPELFRARFEGAVPKVAVVDGTVRIQYPRFRLFGWAEHGAGEIALAPSLPWTIALTGGAADVKGDLRRLHVEGVSISGGVSVVRLQLPRPRGRVTIVITGGVSRLELLRPAVTPVRVLARGGIHDLRVDELALGAVGGRFEYETPDGGPDGYEIDISGGVQGIAIAREPAPELQTETAVEELQPAS